MSKSYMQNFDLKPIKQEEGINYWHWVVFKRHLGEPFVLDSAPFLESNIRQDFEDMNPKWFIEVSKT